MTDRPAAGWAPWDVLDQALARLRACRTAEELAGRGAALAVEGLAAEAAAVVVPVEGRWDVRSRAGRADLLKTDPAGSHSRPGPAEADPVLCRVLATGGAQAAVLPGDPGRCRAVAAVSAGGRSLGVLHVVGVGIDVEMVECFATALGSMMTLVGTWARLEELHRVLDRLASGVSGFTEGAVEIAEPGAPSAAVPLGVRALDPPVHDRLTARQREVLTLMLSGLSNAEIAERLVVAVPTVKSHVRAILRASGAVNRSDAMARLTRTEGQAGRRSYDGAL